MTGTNQPTFYFIKKQSRDHNGSGAIPHQINQFPCTNATKGAEVEAVFICLKVCVWVWGVWGCVCVGCVGVCVCVCVCFIISIFFKGICFLRQAKTVMVRLCGFVEPTYTTKISDANV